MPIEISGPHSGQSSLCEPVLRSLPEWFGIESAILDYIEAIDRMPTFLALDNGRTIGFATICRHFPTAAEIYVMAVRREYHLTGIGRKLLVRSESWLSTNGVRGRIINPFARGNKTPAYQG